MKVWLLAAGLGSLLSSGCRSELTKPTPPSTSQLRADFSAPSGDFKRIPLEGASGVLLDALRRVEQVCGFNPFSATTCPEGTSCPTCHFEAHIAEVLAEISAALNQGKGDGHGPSVGGTDGYLTVDTICPGWDKKARKDPANGTAEIHLSFTGHGFDPVFWGDLTDCALQGASRARRYNGKFILTYEPQQNVPFDQLDNVPAIVWFEGTVYDRDRDISLPIRGATRRRFDQLGPLEFLLETEGYGAFVAEINGSQAEIRGLSQHFSCDLEENECVVIEPG